MRAIRVRSKLSYRTFDTFCEKQEEGRGWGWGRKGENVNIIEYKPEQKISFLSRTYVDYEHGYRCIHTRIRCFNISLYVLHLFKKTKTKKMKEKRNVSGKNYNTSFSSCVVSASLYLSGVVRTRPWRTRAYLQFEAVSSVWKLLNWTFPTGLNSK